MAWYEVKKINKNFLEQTIDSKIKEIANLLANHFSKRKMEEDSYKKEIQESIIGLHGASKVVLLQDFNQPLQMVDIDIKGRGQIDFYMACSVDQDDLYSNKYKVLSKPPLIVFLNSNKDVSLEGCLIDGKTPSKVNSIIQPVVGGSTLYFKESLKIKAYLFIYGNLNMAGEGILFAVITIY